MDLRERVIQLSAGISRLRSELIEFEEKRAKLRVMEKELDSLLREPTTTVVASATNGNGHGTIDDRIMKVLKESPAKTFTTSDVYERLSDLNVDSIRAALSRMAIEEIIQRPERGAYQAK